MLKCENKSLLKYSNCKVNSLDDMEWHEVDNYALTNGIFQTANQKDIELDKIILHKEKRSFNYDNSKQIVVKCGYFLINNFLREFLSKLFNHKEITDYLSCGAIIHNEFVDHFGYMVKQCMDYDFPIQADIYNIPSLCMENINRLSKGLKCMQFDKSITAKNGFYACWSTYSLLSQREFDVIKSDIASIIQYFSLHNIDCRFIEMPITAELDYY